MLLLWILGILLLLFLLVCLLRVRILIKADQTLTLTLHIGPIRRQLYPAVKAKEAKDTKAEQRTETKKAIPKPALSDIKDAYRTLKPALLCALHSTRRGIRIHPLDISVIFGGREDPAGAAETYGYASAAVWTVMPALEQLLTIPDPHVHLDMDFEAEKLQLRGDIGIGIRIGTLLIVVLGIAIPAIRWLFKYTKRSNTAKQQPLPESAA